MFLLVAKLELFPKLEMLSIIWILRAVLLRKATGGDGEGLAAGGFVGDG